MKCPQCGAEFTGHRTHCPQCGAELRGKANKKKKTEEKRTRQILIPVAVALVLVALVCMVQQVMQVNSQREADEVYTQALALYNEGDNEGAIEELEAGITDGIGSVEIYYLLGQAYESLDDMDSAAEAYAEGSQKYAGKSGAETLTEAQLTAYSALMREAYASEDNSTALDYANKVLTLDKDNLEAQKLIDSIYPGSPDNDETVDDGTSGVDENETIDEQEENEDISTINNYIFVCNSDTWEMTWEEAQGACADLGGHLVTIDSDEEYEYLAELGDKYNEDLEDGEYLIYWVGANRSENSYSYYWLDEDGDAYGSSINNSSMWKEAEPSFSDDDVDLDEYVVDFFYWKSESRWVLNDVPNDIARFYPERVGYICEIEE